VPLHCAQAALVSSKVADAVATAPLVRVPGGSNVQEPKEVFSSLDDARSTQNRMFGPNIGAVEPLAIVARLARNYLVIFYLQLPSLRSYVR
jgi:hypothetical protein